MESRRDVWVDGRRFALFESGAGETCVLLHGYPQSHWCWRKVVPLLQGGYRIVAVDWCGWGESERSLAIAPEYEGEVARLERLLETLDPSGVNLLAHDYGGFLALGLAIRHPRRLRRLAILNSRAHATFALPSRLQFGALSWAARTPGLRGAVARLPLYAIHRRAMLRYVRSGCFTAEDLERYLGWLRRRDGRVWLEHFYRHYRVAPRAELRDGCGRVEVPTAIVWGDRDPFCPFAIAADLAARMPQARLVQIRGADHYVMEERPEEVAAALQALLRRPAAGRGPR